MRGGTASWNSCFLRIQGLSPRARGNRDFAGLADPGLGTIPACAGEPLTAQNAANSPRDYPRVRGGTWVRVELRYGNKGLSPRARGNLGLLLGHHLDAGTIPACAGEPFPHPSQNQASRDYPRVRGGTEILRDSLIQDWGLSPRARGNLANRTLYLKGQGTIPACAGEPSQAPPCSTPPGDYPRVRGGTGDAGHGFSWEKGLSPRARGNRRGIGFMAILVGTIPACAGEPCRLRGRRAPAGDYPRVRGGTATSASPGPLVAGLSPRARGNHKIFLPGVPPLGTIPACAGEPTRSR